MSWSIEVPEEPSDFFPSTIADSATQKHVQANFRAYRLLVDHRDPRVAAHSRANMEDPIVARDLFRGFERLAAGGVGAHRFYALADEPILERIQIAMHAMCTLARVQQTGGQATKAVHLSSCWHAAIWLTMRQLEARHEGHHMAFRGQADAQWDLVPSWERVPTEEQRAVLRQRRRFEDVVGATSEALGFPAERSMCRAASQHHGLQTRLLDFTTDPLVGTWFAIDSSHPATARRAVWYRDIPALVRSGCRFVLPPPFLRRLHAQRGFFIHRRCGAGSLKRRMHLATFPASPADADFRPFWLGESIPMYPEVKWLDWLTLQVRERDGRLSTSRGRAALRSEALARARDDQSRSLGAGPDAMTHDRTRRTHDGPWSPDGYAAVAYDALFRLAVVAGVRDGSLVRVDVLRAVIEPNAILMRQLVEAIREPPDGQLPAPSDLGLASLLTQFLDEPKNAQV